VEDSTQTKK